MDDNTLLNISITIAILGIILLLALSFYDKIPENGFNEVTSNNIGSKVKVNGIIKNVYMHNNSQTLKLRQECYMDVFAFDTKNYTIGENITVQGTVQEYNGKMEIIAEKIEINSR
ncbi:MAG: hypothetical protein ACP5OA_05735 [Candidatus Woesearchaeota archaeon]